jgi:hypothetical protein
MGRSMKLIACMRPWFLGLLGLLAGCEVGMAPRTPVRSVLVLSTLGADDESQLAGLLNAAVGKAAGRIGSVTVHMQHLKTNSMRELPAEVRPFVESQRWAAIVTTNLALARIVQRQDPTTPIVFRGAADPVWMCVVDSMRSPGRNATGYTAYLPAEHKMAEALLDAYPALTQLVVLLHGREAVPDDCSAPPLSSKAVRRPCSVAEVPAAVAGWSSWPPHGMFACASCSCATPPTSRSSRTWLARAPGPATSCR